VQVDAAVQSVLVGVESYEVAIFVGLGFWDHNGILKKETSIRIKHMQLMALRYFPGLN